MNRLILSAVIAAALASTAIAQSHQPYAGMQARPIKALSDQQIEDLKGGRGMGLALAAELNGYPGPIHVLELADRLELSAGQRARTQELYAAMKAEAVELGETLIAQEADLDRQFAGKTVTPNSLAASVRAIGNTQAALRAAHLKYHLSMLEILTAAQVHRYTDLRGYSGGRQPQHPHRGRH